MCTFSDNVEFCFHRNVPPRCYIVVSMSQDMQLLECSFVGWLPYGFIQSALVSAHFFSGLAFTFTFMHLADAFIQSDLHCIQVTVLHLISSCFPWESNP